MSIIIYNTLDLNSNLCSYCYSETPIVFFKTATMVFTDAPIGFFEDSYHVLPTDLSGSPNTDTMHVVTHLSGYSKMATMFFNYTTPIGLFEDGYHVLQTHLSGFSKMAPKFFRPIGFSEHDYHVLLTHLSDTLNMAKMSKKKKHSSLITRLICPSHQIILIN